MCQSNTCRWLFLLSPSYDGKSSANVPSLPLVGFKPMIALFSPVCPQSCLAGGRPEEPWFQTLVTNSSQSSIKVVPVVAGAFSSIVGIASDLLIPIHTRTKLTLRASINKTTVSGYTHNNLSYIDSILKLLFIVINEECNDSDPIQRNQHHKTVESSGPGRTELRSTIYKERGAQSP